MRLRVIVLQMMVFHQHLCLREICRRFAVEQPILAAAAERFDVGGQVRVNNLRMAGPSGEWTTRTVSTALRLGR